MTDDILFDKSLKAWFDRQPATTIRDDVVDTALVKARSTRQRGSLALAVVGPAPWPRLGTRAHAFAGAWPRTYVLIFLAILIGLLLAAVGASLVRRALISPPFGENGVIAYALGDIVQPPYNHVHFVNPDGTNDREMMQGSAPQFSVDGSSLGYFSGWGVDSTGPTPPVFHVLHPDGSTLDVAGYAQVAHALSPDGQELVRGGRAVISINIAKGTQAVLVPTGGDGVSYGAPVWSPNGEMVAFAVLTSRGDNVSPYQSEVDIVDVATGASRTVTTRPATDTFAIAWSPDSRAIAYVGLPDGSPIPLGPSTEGLSPPVSLYAIKVDGSGDTLLSGAYFPSLDFGWAPDGSALAFIWFDGNEPHLAVVDLDGTTPTSDPRVGPGATELAWSPDATQIAFVLELDSPAETHATIQTVDRNLGDPILISSVFHSVSSLTWQRHDPGATPAPWR